MHDKKIIFSLQRLLDKFSINENSVPTDLKQWQNFLTHINNSFCDFEQERYLLKRSMELSSAEYAKINKQFDLFGIILDIDKQKRTEKYVKKLNTQLVRLAKYASMSQTASFVLHNIGNVLNSANISLTMAREKTITNNYQKLNEVANLLETIIAEKNCILPNEKIHFIPKYIDELSQIFLTSQQEVKKELNKLEEHLQHIASIISTQHELGGFAGITEKITVKDLLDQSIKLTYEIDAQRDVIQIIKHYQFNETILINKSNVLQILINLLRNAKQAVMSNETQRIKKIDITTQQSMNEGFFDIIISDNGCGIEKNAINKIFRGNYTTKKHGTGLGLHMSAITISEMGGKLSAESPGINQGSTFTLTLPVKTR